MCSGYLMKKCRYGNARSVGVLGSLCFCNDRKLASVDPGRRSYCFVNNECPFRMVWRSTLLILISSKDEH